MRTKRRCAAPYILTGVGVLTAIALFALAIPKLYSLTEDSRSPDSSSPTRQNSGEPAGSRPGSGTTGDSGTTAEPSGAATTSAVSGTAARARQILNTMSLDEKVGQMFLVRCPGSNAAQAAARYHFGGYLLFSSDFKDKTKGQAIADIAGYQNASKIGMLIGVDEEGGTVNRVSLYKNFRAVPFWSPQKLYAKGGWNLIVSDTKEKAELLKSLGINVNMAPVCDISTDRSDFIYDRSFGKGADLTSQYVQKVVNTMKGNRIGSVLKHFPGYGNNKDTHTGMVTDNRSYDTFAAGDFLPFISGIQAGADAVLVSHNMVACMDAKDPASLSENVHRILRDDLQFNGVILTDDLSMDAIVNFTDAATAAVMAVTAGNDMLCSTDFEKQVPAVIDAVHKGTIPESRIDESVTRILCWKLSLGIIE